MATGMRQRPETHSDLTADLYMDVAGVIWLTVFGLVIGAPVLAGGHCHLVKEIDPKQMSRYRAGPKLMGG